MRKCKQNSHCRVYWLNWHRQTGCWQASILQNFSLRCCLSHTACVLNTDGDIWWCEHVHHHGVPGQSAVTLPQYQCVSPSERMFCEQIWRFFDWQNANLKVLWLTKCLFWEARANTRALSCTWRCACTRASIYRTYFLFFSTLNGKILRVKKQS